MARDALHAASAPGANPVGRALALAVLLGACTTAPIYNVTNEPFASPRSLELVGERIERAARLQGWRPERLADDEIIVSRSKGQHTAAATVTFDTRSFSIALRSSSDFKESDGRIHKLYNQWVASLRATIVREVAARN